MKKLAHLVGAVVLAAGGTLGLALPAAAAPTLTAPSWGGDGEVFDVTGTECVGVRAEVVVIADDGTYDGTDIMPPALVIQPDAETGDWGFELTLGTEDVTITASCNTYNSTFDYAPATVQVWQDSLGPVTRDTCTVTIPLTVAYAGDYVLEVADDGTLLADYPFTATAAGASSVTWTIEEPAMTGAAGVGFFLYDSEEALVAEIPNYEYPADVALSCAQKGVTLSFPGYTGEVVAGGTLKIDAAGFLPGEKVTVTLFSTPVVLATLLADTQGRVLGTVTIPAATEPGAHTIEVKGVSSGLSISLPILVKAGTSAPTTTTSRPTTTPAKYTPLLAKTGTTASALVPWAAGLVLLGGAALALTRRRSNTH